MFHFISRVVVVSVFALSLNFAVVPAAQARIQTARPTVTNTDGRCVEQAMEWLNRILGKEKAQKGPKKKITAKDGCLIDPFGNPRPCV
ncbi:MAG: hypothetical protein QOH06_1221 [Acidobacteriota bacterium]|jgi:hypothetical protein|nr:hypothetical protein [Acidobacteriota bacterium]